MEPSVRLPYNLKITEKLLFLPYKQLTKRMTYLSILLLRLIQPAKIGAIIKNCCGIGGSCFGNLP